MEAQPSVWSGFGSSLAVSFASFGLVCLGAWAFFRWLAFRAGGGSERGRGLRLRAKLSLEPRRTIYVVEAGSRAFLIGAGDSGLNLLAELDPADVPDDRPSTVVDRRVSAWWARLFTSRSGRPSPRQRGPLASGPSVDGVREKEAVVPDADAAHPVADVARPVSVGDEAPP